ncbi:MAG: 1-acyl-sn-glycerol-3-phosphate acyltransferase [Deltaproteobacteria bacterium]|nr:1-acyl-sn-glycerol-3-phosphate acyltransferase [Deltaproteobacteria bacterium]
MTIPAYLLATTLVIGMSPGLLIVCLGLDLVRRARWIAVRCLAFLMVYLACETAGILASLGLWLLNGAWLNISPRRFENANYALQRWWIRTLLGRAQAIFGFGFEIEGGVDTSKAPFLFFARHASLPDVIVPSLLFVMPHRLRVRHVMKKELLWDPCLDIVGNRLPNYFVDRTATDTASEIAHVASLGRGLGARDGVMIYPEGTRFTEEKRRRILERLREKGDEAMLAYAESLRHLLPPRLSGSTALLEKAKGAAAVFCAHVGFDEITNARDFLNGALVNATIRVRLWRFEADAIPADNEARRRWFLDQWRIMDDWIDCVKTEQDHDTPIPMRIPA